MGRKFWAMTSRSLTSWELGCQGVELLNWYLTLRSLFHDHLFFLDHVHHFDTGHGALGRLPRHASQNRADSTLHGTMILLHAVVVIAHPADFDRGVVLGVIGGAGLGEETHSRPRTSPLRQEKVDGVARYVHRTIEVAPLPAYATVNNVTRIADGPAWPTRMSRTSPAVSPERKRLT
jgi:hypothetical protein